MEIVAYTAICTVILMIILDLIPHHKLRDKKNSETTSISVLEHWCNRLAEKGIM